MCGSRSARSEPLQRLMAALVWVLALPASAAADGLQLLRVTPAGSDVPARSQIVLAFDRAVVPLGRMERSADEVPVTITPATACQWRWLDAQNLACSLADGSALRAATAYTVEVGSGFTAQDGSSLAATSMHRFVTELPRVRYASFIEWLGPTQPQLRLRFNQPVTAASVERAISVDGLPVRVTAEYDDRDTPFWTPEGEARALWRLTPRVPLAEDHGYALRVAPGLHSALGAQAGIESRKLETFSTFGAPRLLGLRCMEGDRTVFAGPGVRCAPLEGAALVFSTPVSAKALAAVLKIVPAVVMREAGDDESSEADGETPAVGPPPVIGRHGEGEIYALALPFQLAAETDYRLTLGAGLQDRFGRALGSAAQLGLHTGARARNLVFEHSPAVLESGIDSEVPVVVTNLDALQLSAERITATRRDTATRELKLPGVRNLAFATPLGIRALLGGPSGALLGGLSSTPSMGSKPLPFFAEVTPWQVHAKYGNANLLVWVTRMADGRAVADADIAVLDGWHGGVKASGRTDRDGLAELPGSAILDPKQALQSLSTQGDEQEPLVLRVSRGDDIALLPLASEFQVDTWRASREQVSEWRRQRYGHLRSWGTTAQGVYRAGDTLQYKLYVRDDADRSLKPAPANGYTLRIVDPTGTTVEERKNLVLSAFGALDGQFKLASNAAVGWYRFELEPSYAQDLTFEPMRVLVSDFVPAPFRVSAELRAREAMPGTKIGASLRATLHGGGPFANARARITARVEATEFDPDQPLAKRYRFDALESGGRDPEPLVDREAVLDAKGEWNTPLELGDSPVLVGDLVLEGTVQDDRGRAIVGQARLPYFGRDRYIGIRYAGVAQAGVPTEIETLVVGRDSKPLAGMPYYVKIERKVTKGARIKGAGNTYITRYVHEWQRVATCKGRSRADGDRCHFTPDAGGELYATAMTVDSQQRRHESGTWIDAQGANAVLWEDRPDYSLDIHVDQAKYKVGDVARLFVRNPFPGATALITVERYGVLERRMQKLATATPVIEIPIRPDYLPGAYVSVVVMSPRVALPLKDGVDLGKPSFRMGYATLPVEDPYRELQVQVTPSKTEARPREDVQVALAAKPRHASGEPVEFAVAVLDEAVFDLIQGGAGYFDPLKGFSQLDPLDLANYSLLTRLVGRQKFEKKGASAGGDGGADLALRSVDQFVAYWNPALKADAQGRARFTFTTPDNLSGWRVLAMATTPSDRMGLGQGRLAVNKPTELRAALPNQLTLGDQVDAGFTVMNRAKEARTLSASIEASGAASATTKQSLSLQPFERRTVQLPLTIVSGGSLHLVARAGDASDSDALQLDLPVRERPLTMTAAVFSSLTAQAPLRIPLQLPADATRADLRLAFASSVLGNLDGAFAYMADYPYLCWEQRLTKAVMAAHFLKLHDRLAAPPAWTEATTLAQRTLDDAASFQAPGGGMSYFEPQDERQSPYLSAYTALAFGWLQELGYRPQAEVWTRLDTYLQRLLREDIAASGYGGAEVRAQVRAVALAALARHKGLKAEELARYAPQLPRMGLFGEALYAQAAAQTAGAADAVQLAAQRMLARGQQSAGSLLLADDRDSSDAWLLGSSLRSNCAALSALLASGADAEQAMRLTRAITQARGSRTHWQNTQENLFCTRALIEYAERYEAVPLQMTVRAALDDQLLGVASLAAGRAASFAAPLATGAAARTLSVSGEGVGRAYLSTTLRYATPPPQTAIDAGLALSRSYFVRRGGQWQKLEGPLMHVQQGEQLKIELALSVPVWTTYVVVDDPVPAGLEPINSDLATASGLAAEELAAASPSYPYPFYHRELRFSAVRFYADEVAAGRYRLAWLAQAVATGEFAVTETHAERMYDPDVFGNGVASRLKVEAAP